MDPISAHLPGILLAYAAVMVVLKIAGGAYLLWLGYKALRSSATAKDLRAGDVMQSGAWTSYFRRGLAVQMTNPKAALAMIAIVSLGIQEGSPVWVGVAIVVGTALLSLLGHLSTPSCSRPRRWWRSISRPGA